MKYLAYFLLLLVSFSSQAVTDESTPQAEEVTLTAEEQKYIAWARDIWDSLDRQHGTIKLPNGVATLTVPDNFYYLKPTDAEKILVDVWGNPPGAGQESLGMLFPNEGTPFDGNSWGVIIEYIEEGYVSDADADDIDYDDLLADMQESTRAENSTRVEQGYDPIELVGWAAAPFYDKESNKLHWAKELKFGDRTPHTLNYNIRVLGRKGVLQLNFIAGMEQKELIDTNLVTVLAMADFDQGFRYADFNPDIDEVAAYGLGAVVAGKAMAKTGFLAAGLIFLKKFGVVILIGIGVLLGKLFKRKKLQTDTVE
jgi:uncharacterized membrane-anchored protein